MDILLDLQFCYKVFNGAQDGLFIWKESKHHLQPNH